MKRMLRLFCQHDFHLFAFVVGFLAMNWPFLSIFEGKGPEALILYLYALWTLVIVLLFCVARSLSSPSGKGP